MNAQLHFRSLRLTDHQSVKELHEELFPVKYSDEFYDSVVKNETLDGRPLYSCVAVACARNKESCYRVCYGNGRLIEIDQHPLKRLGQYIGIEKDILSQLDQDSSQSTSDGPLYFQQITKDTPEGYYRGISTFVNDDELSLIETGSNNAINPAVGVIVGAFMSIRETNIQSLKKLVRNPKTHDRLFYIMTLGSSHSMRRKGLSTKLVSDCIRLVRQVKDCGAIYLHVITHNDAAIQFYEKLGFYRIEEIQDYYLIDGETFNCYLYAKFVNGNRQSFMDTMYLVYKKILSSLQSYLPFKKVSTSA